MINVSLNTPEYILGGFYDVFIIIFIILQYGGVIRVT